jgi:hypothetical protein
MRVSLVGIVFASLLVNASCTGDSGDNSVFPQADGIGGDSRNEVVCVSPLILWNEYGVCGPSLEAGTAPYQLPLVGGGVTVVGPRLCPKSWNIDAEIGCTAGTFTEYDGKPCPFGQELNSDGTSCVPVFDYDCSDSELPLYGGGCSPVGPAWFDASSPEAGFENPLFDKCPDGQYAAPGGGCFQIGPRACPKVFDPESIVNCETPNLLSCPANWNISSDGIYCEPTYSLCNPGERALDGGDCIPVVSVVEDCPTTQFPSLPEDVTSVVYVSASSICSDNCGSQDNPYASISTALDALPDGGGTILIAEGEYVEGLQIDKQVKVMGLCAALVTVTGQVEESGEQSDNSSAGIIVSNVSNVEISGIRIKSPSIGIIVKNSYDVELKQIDITEASGLALLVGENSTVEVSDSWIHDTKSSADQSWMKGYGFWIEEGATVSMANGLIENAIGAGFYISGKATSLALSETEIRSTLPLPGGSFGTGISATKDSSLSLKDVYINNCTGAGLFLSQGASAEITRSRISGTNEGPKGGAGSGMMVLAGAQAWVSESLFADNVETGVYFGDSGTQGVLHQCVVKDTRSLGSGHFGCGVTVNGGAQIQANGCLLDGNRADGFLIGGSGTSVTIAGTIVRNTMSDENGFFGQGLQAMDQAFVDIRASLFENNTLDGLLAVNKDTLVQMQGTTVRDTQPANDSFAGHGAYAEDEAELQINSCLFERNREAAVYGTGDGTHVAMTNSTARETDFTPSGDVGMGAGIFKGASAILTSCLFETNLRLAVVAQDESTSLEMEGCAIRNTIVEPDTEYGSGLHIGDGATVIVSKSLFLQNALSGASVYGENTSLEMSDSVIMGSVKRSDDHYGFGAQITSKASSSFIRCAFTENNECGILAVDEGTVLSVSDSLIANTQMTNSELEAVALQVSTGANGTAGNTLIINNAGVGVLAQGLISSLTLTGVVVLDTVPLAHNAATGIGVNNGATLDANRCLIENTIGMGAGVQEHGSVLRMENSVIRNTVMHPDIGGGLGILTNRAGEVSITGCLVENSQQGGILAEEPDTKLSVVQSTIRQDSEFLKGLTEDGFGFGLSAAGGARVKVVASLVENSRLAGIWSQDASTLVEIFHTLVRFGTRDDFYLLGAGAVATSGATMNVSRTICSRNETAGLLALETSTSMLVSESVTSFNTLGGIVEQNGDGTVGGDGMAAVEGAYLEVERSISEKNERTGIVYSTATGWVKTSIMAGNGSFGLAIQDCTQSVQYENSDNHAIGNQKLPQMTSSPDGLPVPDIPGIIDLPVQDVPEGVN